MKKIYLTFFLVAIFASVSRAQARVCIDGKCSGGTNPRPTENSKPPRSSEPRLVVKISNPPANTSPMVFRGDSSLCPELEQIVKKEAREFGNPQSIYLRVSHQSGNLRAATKGSPFSPAFLGGKFATETSADCSNGRDGCMEINAVTAKQMGLAPGNRWEPLPAFKAAVKYLNYQSKIAGFKISSPNQAYLALFGYNRGHGYLVRGVKLVRAVGFKTIGINELLWDEIPDVRLRDPKKEEARKAAVKKLLEYRASAYTQNGIQHIARVRAHEQNIINRKAV